MPLTRNSAWIWTAFAVALVLRLTRLGHAPLWFDETFTARQVEMPWGEMVRAVIADSQMPLYYLLLKAWYAVAGGAPWTLRLPGALFSAATVLLVAAVADALAGRSAARWAAWLAALSPYLIQHGQEARAYALVTAFGAAHLLLLARFATGRAPRLGGAFVGVGFLLVAAHHTSVFFLAGELLALLLLWRRPLRTWFPAAVTIGVVGLAIPLAAFRVVHPYGGGHYDLSGFALPGIAWSLIGGYTLLPTSEALHAAGWRAAVAYLPVVLPATLAAAVIGVAGLRSVDRTARIVLGVTLVVTLLAQLAARLMVGTSVHPRYSAAAAPALLVLLAAGRPARLRADLRTMAMIALVATMGFATALHLREPGHGREDVQAAGAWLDAHVPLDEKILVTSREMETLARFHWPARALNLYPPAQTVVTPENVDRMVAALPASGSGRVIYVVGRAWLSDPQGLLQRRLGERYPPCPGIAVRGITVLCLLRPND